MKNSYSCLACMLVAFVVGIFVGMICEEQQEHRPVSPPLGDCEEELEMERHWHGEYYREWERCRSEISRYALQSIEAVCLEEYDKSRELLDECWDARGETMMDLYACHGELGECELRLEGIIE